MTTVEQDAEDYIKGDRQWTRTCRLAHARLMLSLELTEDGKTFWRLVVKANSRSEQ